MALGMVITTVKGGVAAPKGRHLPHIGGAESLEIPAPPTPPRKLNAIALAPARLHAADVVWQRRVSRIVFAHGHTKNEEHG